MHRLFFYELLSVATTLIALSQAATTPRCYGIDLVQDPNNFPCDPNVQDGPCCALGNTCLSNGLCSPNSTQNFGETPYYTSECSDSSWESDSCLKICNTNTTSNITGNGVQPCHGGNFCCYDLNKADCCNTPSLTFQLGVATIVTHLTGSPTASASLTSTATSSSQRVTSSPHTTSSSPTRSPKTSPTPTSSGQGGSSNHVAVGVGVGVGVAAGIAVLGVIAFFVRRQQIKKKRNETPIPLEYMDVKNEAAKASETQRLHELPEDRGVSELQGDLRAHEMR